MSGVLGRGRHVLSVCVLCMHACVCVCVCACACCVCMCDCLSAFLFSVGRPKHVRIMAGGVEGDTFIGPKAQEHRGLLHIKYPMEVGQGGWGVDVRAGV